VPKSFACVAMLVFLLSPPVVAAQIQARTEPHFLVGVHGGFNFTHGSVDDKRFGVQGSIPYIWRLTIDPVFSYVYHFDDPSGVYRGSQWQTYLTVRVHPLGNDSFLSVGYGFTLVRTSLHTRDHTFSQSDFGGTDVGVIGLTYPKGRVRPFADMYLVDLLERENPVGGHLLFGVNLRIP